MTRRTEQKLDAVVARLVRIETRLTRLALYLGIDPTRHTQDDHDHSPADPSDTQGQPARADEQRVVRAVEPL
ncbi:hypothetical protein KTH35_19300, partial [Acinetobacter baumannii]|nr:hypothetical protein [Acinetobacter baumannii]